MVVGGILLALGLLAVVIVHFRLLDPMVWGARGRQPPVDIKRR
jgi:hypothetical protein